MYKECFLNADPFLSYRSVMIPNFTITAGQILPRSWTQDCPQQDIVPSRTARRLSPAGQRVDCPQQDSTEIVPSRRARRLSPAGQRVDCPSRTRRLSQYSVLVRVARRLLRRFIRTTWRCIWSKRCLGHRWLKIVCKISKSFLRNIQTKPDRIVWWYYLMVKHFPAHTCELTH